MTAALLSRFVVVDGRWIPCKEVAETFKHGVVTTDGTYYAGTPSKAREL